MTPDLALSYWLRALSAEFGWAIPVSGGVPALRKAQRILYDARKAQRELGDQRLETIMMCMPNGGKEIWLVKKEVEIDT